MNVQKLDTLKHWRDEKMSTESTENEQFKPKKSHLWTTRPEGAGRKKTNWNGFAGDLKHALHKLTDHGDQTKKAAIIDRLINFALDENMPPKISLAAIELILNRTDGAPKQSIELSALKPADEWSREELNNKLAEAGLAIAAARNPLDLIECRTDGEVIESEATR